MSVTIARSVCVHALSRLDLPTLGRPTMATCRPWRSRLPCRLVRSASSMSRCRSVCVQQGASASGTGSGDEGRACQHRSAVASHCHNNLCTLDKPPPAPLRATHL
jgi:hypothetical protein